MSPEVQEEPLCGQTSDLLREVRMGSLAPTREAHLDNCELCSMALATEQLLSSPNFFEDQGALPSAALPSAGEIYDSVFEKSPLVAETEAAMWADRRVSRALDLSRLAVVSAGVLAAWKTGLMGRLVELPWATWASAFGETTAVAPSQGIPVGDEVSSAVVFCAGLGLLVAMALLLYDEPRLDETAR